MSSSLLDQLKEAFSSMFNSIIAWTPRIVMGLLLVIVALIVAKIAERLLRAILVRMRFDQALARTGADKLLERIGIRQELNRGVPRLVYWLLLLLFAKTAADSVGLVAVSQAIGAFAAYLPNIIAAVFIIILGGAAAQFAGGAVSEAAESSGIEFSSTLGSLVSGVLMFVLGIMALSQLKIDTDMMRLVAMGLMAGLALAFGLSFGLGSRDITRNIIAGFYARKTFTVGEAIEISGERGTLEAITPTQTLLDQEGTMVAVSNSVFLEQVVKQ
ncbi:MAG: mechanosensitive ion channel [Gemmatimonadota bacterium]|nr:mechanosensitive ion channel [Gemmatimonadota bacterium]